jgi:hypothetical protein
MIVDGRLPAGDRIQEPPAPRYATIYKRVMIASWLKARESESEGES